jgi:hypothetical protein
LKADQGLEPPKQDLNRIAGQLEKDVEPASSVSLVQVEDVLVEEELGLL